MGPVPDVELRARGTSTTGPHHHGCRDRTREDQNAGAGRKPCLRSPTNARSAEFQASVRLHIRPGNEGLVRRISGRESQDVQPTGHFD